MAKGRGAGTTLEKASWLEDIYDWLWKSHPTTDKQCEAVYLPHTVILRYQRPAALYTTESDGSIRKTDDVHSLRASEVVKQFMQNATSPHVVAQYVSIVRQPSTRVEASNYVEDEQATVEYLDASGFAEFLQYRHKENSGVVQQFVVSANDRNCVMRAHWTPRHLAIGQRTNTKRFGDKRYPLQNRCVTFDGKENESTDLDLKTGGKYIKVKAATAGIIEHIQAQLPKNYRIWSIVLYFKMCAQGVAFLYCGSLRLHRVEELNQMLWTNKLHVELALNRQVNSRKQMSCCPLCQTPMAKFLLFEVSRSAIFVHLQREHRQNLISHTSDGTVVSHGAGRKPTHDVLSPRETRKANDDMESILATDTGVLKFLRLGLAGKLEEKSYAKYVEMTRDDEFLDKKVGLCENCCLLCNTSFARQVGAHDDKMLLSARPTLQATLTAEAAALSSKPPRARPATAAQRPKTASRKVVPATRPVSARVAGSNTVVGGGHGHGAEVKGMTKGRVTQWSAVEHIPEPQYSQRSPRRSEKHARQNDSSRASGTFAGTGTTMGNRSRPSPSRYDRETRMSEATMGAEYSRYINRTSSSSGVAPLGVAMSADFHADADGSDGDGDGGDYEELSARFQKGAMFFHESVMSSPMGYREEQLLRRWSSNVDAQKPLNRAGARPCTAGSQSSRNTVDNDTGGVVGTSGGDARAGAHRDWRISHRDDQPNVRDQRFGIDRDPLTDRNVSVAPAPTPTSRLGKLLARASGTRLMEPRGSSRRSCSARQRTEKPVMPSDAEIVTMATQRAVHASRSTRSSQNAITYGRPVISTKASRNAAVDAKAAAQAKAAADASRESEVIDTNLEDDANDFSVADVMTRGGVDGVRHWRAWVDNVGDPESMTAPTDNSKEILVYSLMGDADAFGR